MHGQALLGHELSHVVSQARGEVRGSGLLENNSLESRGIRVCGPLFGEAARKPFELYRKLGGVIY